MIVTTIAQHGPGFLLSMSWPKYNGQTVEIEVESTNRQYLHYRAIIESRFHVLFALDDFLNEVKPTPETPPKAAYIWQRLAELSQKMEASSQTHFQLCERILDNARFYTAIIPKLNYSEAMARWRFVLEIIETELNNKEKTKWIYD